jgi:isochorismate synthase
VTRRAQAEAHALPERAAAASEIWQDRDGQVIVEAADGDLWLGGQAFAPGPDDPVWAGFGPGGFVRAARRSAPAPRPGPLPAIRAVDGDRDGYRRGVAAAARAIAAGALAKVVLARRVRVQCASAIDPATLFARLEAPGVTRFLFRRGDAAFVGATPERLIAKRGRYIETEALAGSATAAAQLGAKERAEHALVVDAIADALAPLCVELDVPAAPTARALRHIVHFATPIRGQLRRDRHILELAAALHPTPAVGGVPRAAALAFIRAHEPAARGWYAGPVGWYDDRGDGELTVALRSAVVHGATAHLYAGAGIVAGSDPDAELAETDLKLRTILEAWSC